MDLKIDLLEPCFLTKLRAHTSAQDPFKKAIGKPLSKQRVLDATGGFLEDALLLCAWGAQVHVLERNKNLFEQMSSEWERVRSQEVYKDIASRFVAYENKDSIVYLNELKEVSFDVIYLDPMYPESNKSALRSGRMRSLRESVGVDDDIEDLLEAAIKCPVARVVLKRPLKSELLCKEKFLHSFEGKSTRFDLYSS